MEPPQRRNRRRRAGAISAFMVFALGLAFFFESQATTTVIFVRHADAPLVVDADTALSASGALRAEELARVLGDVDVVQGVDDAALGRERDHHRVRLGFRLQELGQPRDHAPEENRVTVMENVPLHREIAAAAKEDES